MTTKRWCYYIPAAQRDEQGYIPSVVTENEAGHQPLLGNGEGARPWYWGKTYEAAQATADEANAKLGLTKSDVTEIITSSLRLSFQNQG